MPANWAQDFAVGANLGNQIMDRNVRMQELRSQQAHRQFIERQEAQRVEMLLEESNRKREQFQMEVQDRADTIKAMVGMQAEMNPGAIVADLDPQLAGQMNKKFGVSPQVAAMNHLLPIVARRGSKAVDQFITDLSLSEARESQALRSEALAVKDLAAAQGMPAINAATLENKQASTALLKERTTALKTGGGKSFAPTELQRMFDEAKAAGTPWSPEEQNLARRVHSGIDPRKRAPTPEITEDNFVAKFLPQELKNKPTKKVSSPGRVFGTNTKDVPLTVQETVDMLRERYHTIFGDGDSSSVDEPATDTPLSTPSVGDIIKGYRFKGGWPPSDQRAWEKVQ